MKPSKISIKTKGARLVGVELDDTAVDLETFEHLRRCVYLLGAEDNGLSKKRSKMPSFSQIKSEKSLNVSVAGSIVLMIEV
jgi:tRNA G18 (ribose-2'-O)-methylase SpoU